MHRKSGQNTLGVETEVGGHDPVMWGKLEVQGSFSHRNTSGRGLVKDYMGKNSGHHMVSQKSPFSVSVIEILKFLLFKNSLWWEVLLMLWQGNFLLYEISWV